MKFSTNKQKLLLNYKKKTDKKKNKQTVRLL